LASAALVVSVGLVRFPASVHLLLGGTGFRGQETKKRSSFLLFLAIVLLAHPARSPASAAHLNLAAAADEQSCEAPLAFWF